VLVAAGSGSQMIQLGLQRGKALLRDGDVCGQLGAASFKTRQPLFELHGLGILVWILVRARAGRVNRTASPRSQIADILAMPGVVVTTNKC